MAFNIERALNDIDVNALKRRLNTLKICQS